MTVSTLFLFCAALGGAIMVVQLAFSLIGFGMESADGGLDFSGDAEIDVPGDALEGDASEGIVGHDSLANELFRVFSFRTLTAGFTFFGLGGLAGGAAGLGVFLSLLIAIVLGGAALFFVYWIYKKIHAIRADGTVSVKSLIGAHGKVYVRIPANRSGSGKVLINQQERTMEYEALTPGEMIPSGMEIVITKVISSNSVEVGPA